MADMKEIKLTKGKVALVDDEDFKYLNQFKWCLKAGKKDKTEYAKRAIYISGKQKIILMHREIMKVADSKIEIDHDDHNGLNNQKYNLRKCTHAQNTRNKLSSGGTSIHLGVYFRYFNVKYKDKIHSYGRWCAQISLNSKPKHVGAYKTELEAAIAYNIAAQKHYGEFANLNKI